jgi:hypothetical protein
MAVLKISQIEVNEEKHEWWFVEPYDDVFQEYDSIDGYPVHIINKVEEIISKKIGNKKVKVTVFSYKDVIGSYDILDYY